MIRTSNTKAPPLFPPGCSRLVDCSGELGVGLRNMLVDFLASLLNLSDRRFLLDYRSFQVLEHLSQDEHVLFDLLDGLMSTANVIGNCLSLASAVAVNKLGHVRESDQDYGLHLQLD